MLTSKAKLFAKATTKLGLATTVAVDGCVPLS